MSERANETLSLLKKEGKLVVELKGETVEFYHKVTGILLLKRVDINHAIELFEMWSR